MRLTLVTPPTVAPLSLDETKAHLRVEFDKEDDLIRGLITGAREAFERETGRQLLTATWRLFLDRFPRFDREPIELPRPPLQSVSSIKYLDSAGAEQPWASSEYTTEALSGPKAERGVVFPKPDKEYPVTRVIPNAVTIDFIAGYGDEAEDVPEEIKEVLLAWIGHRYENREAVMVGQAASMVPLLSFEPWKDDGFG